MKDVMTQAVGETNRDGEVTRAVQRALEEDVVVPSERIRCTVAAGVVTLEGKVELWRQYDEVERAVRGVPHVREVRNHLDVEPGPPPGLPGYT